MNSKVARVTRLGPLEPRQGLLVGTQDPFALGAEAAAAVVVEISTCPLRLPNGNETRAAQEHHAAVQRQTHNEREQADAGVDESERDFRGRPLLRLLFLGNSYCFGKYTLREQKEGERERLYESLLAS
jgi:hypothetical protein